jgi:hypothetical protein
MDAEILDDKHVREMTRAFCGLFVQLLVLPDGSMVGGPQKTTGHTILPDNAHFHHIFSHEALCCPLLRSLTDILCWPDSLSCQKAAKLLLCCVPFIVQRPALHERARDILQACLKTLAVASSEEVDGQVALWRPAIVVAVIALVVVVVVVVAVFVLIILVVIVVLVEVVATVVIVVLVLQVPVGGSLLKGTEHTQSHRITRIPQTQLCRLTSKFLGLGPHHPHKGDLSPPG